MPTEKESFIYLRRWARKQKCPNCKTIVFDNPFCDVCGTANPEFDLGVYNALASEEDDIGQTGIRSLDEAKRVLCVNLNHDADILSDRNFCSRCGKKLADSADCAEE